MSQKDPQIWQRRWEALDGSIEELKIFTNGIDADWAKSIHDTLICLQRFGKLQFDFFQGGFQDGSLHPSSLYVAEYAIRHTIDQIAYDLSVLRQAALQRSTAPSLPRIAKTLEFADRLAYRALKPAIDVNLLNDTVVFTYLQKVSYVRVRPYAPIAMIGIPETCTGILNKNNEIIGPDKAHTARDFLAIAHEVGHYVFWHGKKRLVTDNGDKRTVLLRTYLRSKVPNAPVWRYSWLEEIFADVYGALIAGPVLALDFQEILFDNADLMLDDGEHPTPVIRPHIYTQTLKQLASRSNVRFINAPNILEDQWESWRQERDQDGSFTPRGRNEPIKAFDAEGLLTDAIRIILEALKDMLPQIKLWSVDTDSPDKTMYDEFFTNILKDKSNEFVPPKFKAKDKVNKEDPIPDKTAVWEIGRSQANWLELLKEAKKEPLTLTLLPERGTRYWTAEAGPRVVLITMPHLRLDNMGTELMAAALALHLRCASHHSWRPGHIHIFPCDYRAP